MTKISWTEQTWNPVTGCDRVSPGCAACYAMRMAARLKAMGQAKYQADGDPRTSGPGFGVTCHPGELRRPMTWRKDSMVFVCSMADLFHQDVPREFVADVFETMAATPQHTYQILTKRSQRMMAMNKRWLTGAVLLGLQGVGLGYAFPLRNVWLGVSIENDNYTFRADHLRETPAAIRFISAEPLLDNLSSLNLEGIDWLIVGCESGPGARPMALDWARDLRDRCAASGTKFFVKQLHLGSLRAETDIDKFPVDLQIREMP